MENNVTIRKPDDFHLHLRDGESLQAVLAYSAQQFARAIIMPNLKPPITDLESARAYKTRILDALGNSDEERLFTPLLSAYLCDSTDPAMLRAAHAEGLFTAAKYYPAGATTHSEFGVSSAAKISKVLETMQAIGMPLLIHGESTDPTVDIFDREAVFIERTLAPIRQDFPALKIVLEHITTAIAAEFVAAGNPQTLAATITPQHLMFNRNALFNGGIRPHFYCLPILKREKHRLALRKVATSGAPNFFLGTDSAPHSVSAKECACGCAGIFSAPVALAAYATVFEEENALHLLENFASVNGAHFYGLPLNEGQISLYKHPYTVPETLPFGKNAHIAPFLAGSEMRWRMQS